MADKRRFELFARFLVRRFPAARRVYDVAGGMGRLNLALAELGLDVVTFDSRRKRLPVSFAERHFALEEPCACDLVVGLHPDGATRLIIAYAARHRIPFSVVPCCSDNGMPYKPWLRHLAELARASRFAVEESTLPMAGRALIVTGAPE
ncbi:MAG: hypothetical protein HY554_08390 [Elusimicrobia bacterium]|nr:hypothetical protein [Elusimicrobiota bacterium]